MSTPYIKKLRKRFIDDCEQKKYHQAPIDKFELAERYAAKKHSDTERAVLRLQAVLEAENPYVWEDEKIALIRTVTVLPEIFTMVEMDELRQKYTIHEQGKVCNITPDYSLLLDCGFDAKRKEINSQLSTADAGQMELLVGMLRTLDIIEDFASRYHVAAVTAGNSIVAESFSIIPAKPPQTFLQALQFLRLLHYCLWTSFNYHNTLGRFDQYLYPYLKADMESGLIDEEIALEQLEEFFLSCNKDSDLYTGMQQGDNGQSIVLGGFDENGKGRYNKLSQLCLDACESLKLIDPKINLRVSSKTPLSLYEKGSRLTKLGLGFPQYSNDDIVVPCLLSWGYRSEDAYNYTVAACWEVIIPGYGMDIPNINGLSFAAAVQESMPVLPNKKNFNAFLDTVHSTIDSKVSKLIDPIGEVYMEPAPLMSMMMHDCITTMRDISHGSRYNNYGIHGTGLSTAVDSLAAIRHYVFEEKFFSAQQMLDMVENDFQGFEKENNILRYEAPKMGNDDDKVDSLATQLLDWFADAVKNRTNSRGGIYRVGTGSAMYYIWHAVDEPASADGRRRGEPLACNYSPSLFSRCSGPISIIKSFSKPNLNRVANGGPLTIELHDMIFRDDESIRKVAMFVKSFMDMGGHQMQINTINRDTLLDARKHPENHRNLIVRVWGWSGYYVELDEVYQDHILKRTELSF